MRCKLIEADLVECVLGLGPGLFYNSLMEACVIICRSRKPAERQGRILFIDAVAEIARERSQSFLRGAHQARIFAAYRRLRTRWLCHRGRQCRRVGGGGIRPSPAT